MPDRDRNEGSARVAADAVLRRLQRAQQGECLEVDADEADAGLLARVHVAVDQLAVRDHEQDALRRVAFFVDAFAEDLIVQHRLVDRDRQRLLCAEPDRVGELLRVVDAGDLEGADADAVVGDSEPHALLGQVVSGEELLQGRRERIRVAELPPDHDSRLERLARNL